MKIYQVIECSGSYDDYCETVVETFFDENKAKELKQEKDRIYDALRRDAEECYDCNFSQFTCNELEEARKMSCFKEHEYGCCDNYDAGAFDDVRYKIENYEVTE